MKHVLFLALSVAVSPAPASSGGWRFQSRTFVPGAAGDARLQLR
jgi:hypothetical protein